MALIAFTLGMGDQHADNLIISQNGSLSHIPNSVNGLFRSRYGIGNERHTDPLCFPPIVLQAIDILGAWPTFCKVFREGAAVLTRSGIADMLAAMVALPAPYHADEPFEWKATELDYIPMKVKDLASFDDAKLLNFKQIASRRAELRLATCIHGTLTS